jgi:hypothetical protein
MAGRRVSNKRLYALWKETPSRVSNDDLWRVLAMLKDHHEADQLGNFLAEVAGRELGSDPGVALRVRNVLRDLPEQLKALPMWQHAMRRVVRIVGGQPFPVRHRGGSVVGDRAPRRRPMAR